MLLLIDAGNTRIKWALLDPIQAPKLGEWLQMDSFTHQEFLDANSPWNNLPVRRVVVSNVAGGALREQLCYLLMRSFQDKNYALEWFIPEQKRAGINNKYRFPAQLGSDRFAAAIAARALFPDQALVIATCGTALTIDAITAEGDFLGGLIIPGIKLMAESLSQNTAQLPTVAGNTVMAAHFADHTEMAMVSGCLTAQVGAIEYAVREFARTLNNDLLCVMSGGGAKYITPNLRIPHKLVDNLVLIGLQVIS
ncbi:MAG: type pantothenate kinase [Solimicrobium sp.]|jgi:type III pantothenate kinase|nr:type pantothenate kinase [Solimicrobium sp.]